jgi:hypothetical protein
VPDNDETELGRMLRSADLALSKTIDVDAVIRRSRKRRIPRLVAVGAASVLAVCFVVGGGALGLRQLGTQSSASSASSGQVQNDAAAPEASPPLGVPGCGTRVPPIALARDGLVASAALPTAVGARAVPASVVLTNTGASPVSGVASAPTVTLSRDGIVVWDGVGTAETPIEIAPGRSLALPSSLTPATCAGAVPPGTYDVSVVVRVSVGGTVELVSGAPSTITLR